MNNKDLENSPEKQLSFKEAAQFLEGKIDLNQELDKAVKMHQRWGIVRRLINMRRIKNEDEYRQLLQTTTFSEQDLQKMVSGIDAGGKILPVFNAGKMDLYMAWKMLIMESGFAFLGDGYVSNNLTNVHKILPGDLYDLPGLDKKSTADQLNAFKTAHPVGDIIADGPPKVLFTPDYPEVIRTNATATQDVQLIAENKMKTIDPVSDLFRFRQQTDVGLKNLAQKAGLDFDNFTPEQYLDFLRKCINDKSLEPLLPDRQKVTQYPQYALPNGSILTLDFLPVDGLVALGFISPSQTTRIDKKPVGARLAFY